jgi:hypothetical protein
MKLADCPELLRKFLVLWGWGNNNAALVEGWVCVDVVDG